MERETHTTRRGYLRGMAGAGLLAAGTGMIGTASAAEGIPTPWLERASRNGPDSNRIVDPQGNQVVLRGVNIADPGRLDNKDMRYHVNAETVTRWALDESEGWYNRIIRIPCQPGDILNKGYGGAKPGAMGESDVRAYIEDHLRPVVDLCGEQGAYCIVDYHRHLDSQLLYTNDTLSEELHMFWEIMASEFAEDSHVLFEVYNEPIAPYPGHNTWGGGVDVANEDSQAARETWDTWKQAAQPWVDTIRENAPRNLILIGSPRWSQWTYWAPKNEFEGDNLAYTGHVYAHPNLRPLGEYFGTPAEEVPVFMTEFGYDDEGQDYIKGTTSEEGQQFKQFFEDYPSVHWQVWCFDTRWQPAMFSGEQGVWTLLGGENYHGKFFKDLLAAKRSEDLPLPGTETTPTTSTETTTPTETTPTTPTETTPTETTPTTTTGGEPDWPTDATDPNGDGLYEDFSGDGSINFPDVNTFFQHSDTERVSRNTQFYDFTDDGSITLQDVMALFQMV
ncbi:MAG: cellulase family glycosylhydrolase [Halococcoides sp.]